MTIRDPSPGGSRQRRFWGWGWEDSGPDPAQVEAIRQLLAARFGVPVLEVAAPPRVEELALPAPRVAPPASLAPWCSSAPFDRAGHTYGKSFRDVVRGYARDFAHPPDFVAFPRSEGDVIGLLDW